VEDDGSGKTSTAGKKSGKSQEDFRKMMGL
jgi:hypothetical protein